MQVSSETTLAQLHRILQRVMGWEGSHRYQFDVSGREFSDPRMLEEMEGEDARRVTLETLVRGEKSKFLYEYDFGDRWEHELLVEKILPGEALPRVPHGQTRLSPGGLW
jgi:pRiA4b ORF-3-like protein